MAAEIGLGLVCLEASAVVAVCSRTVTMSSVLASTLVVWGPAAYSAAYIYHARRPHVRYRHGLLAVPALELV